MKKRLLLIITFLLHLATGWSQTTLKGKVLNEHRQPLEGVIIQITPPYDSVVLANGVTTEDGSFSIEVETENVYRIRTSHSAYEPADLPLVFVAYPGPKNLADIYLKESVAHDELSGSIGVIGGFGWAEKAGVIAALQRNTSKIASYAQFSYRRNQSHQVWDIKQDLPFDEAVHHMEIRNFRRPVTTEVRGKGGVRIRVKPALTIGIHFSGYYRKGSMSGFADVLQDQAAFTMNQSEQHTTKYVLAGLDLTHSWNENTYVRAEADLIRHRNSLIAQYTMGEDHSTTEVNNHFYTPVNVYVGKLTFNHGIAEGFEIESGIKLTRTSTVFIDRNTRLPHESWPVSDPTSPWHYAENIVAGYIQTAYKIDSGWLMSLGMRYEQATMNKTTDDPELPITTTHQDHFLPSLSMAGRIGQHHRLAASYTQRIGRPSFIQLSSTAVFLSPNSCITGNPDLIPAMNRISRLEYSFKEMEVSFQYNRMSDAMFSFITDLDEDRNMLHYTVKNFDFMNIWEVSATVPFTITPWWDSRMEFTRYHYSMGSFTLNRNYLKMVNTLKLPKGITMELAANYQSESLFSIDRNDSFGTLEVGFTKNIGEKTRLNIAVMDIFASYRTFYQSSDSETGFSSEVLQRPESRIFTVSLTWNFSQGTVKKITPASSDDMDRLKNYLVLN